ncbi:MAG: hypothetical protein ACM3QS_07560, partial [Bacteroidota bacterium]
MSPKNLLPPEDGAAFKKLQELAESIHPRPEFESRLEQGLRRAHRPESRLASLWHDIFQFASWAAATLLLALFLNWLIQSGRPVRIPAVRATRTPAPESTTPDLRATPQSSPEPQGTGLEWRGTKLYINAELPGGPEQAAVLALRPEEAATLQSVHELASRFGVQGQVYRVPGEIADTANFMLTDGRQRLQVRSDRYFAYYPDYPAYLNSATTLDVPDAGELIGEFMRAHGIDMPYRVEKSEIYGGFYALPVAAGDLTVHHQYFKPSGYFFRFGREGILAVEANLLTYQELGTFGLLSAREALDMVLD